MKPVINERLPEWIVKHLEAYIRTDGREGHMWDARPYGGDKVIPTLLLTTQGRKSGNPYTIPLIYYQDGKSFVVAGSRGGSAEHAHWYLNLMSASGGWVQVVADHHKVRAELIVGSDREHTLMKLVELFPPYLDYERKTKGVREIPLVRLTPVPG